MASTERPRPTAPAEPYRHPESTSLMRPDVGTQAQFKKRKPPKEHRYDSSLSPTLEWDGQNRAREEGEALLRKILDAGPLEDAKDAASKLKAMSRPFLNWAGKAERLSFEVPTLPLFVHERLGTQAILETLKGHALDKQTGFQFFLDPRHSIRDQVLKAYEYEDKWVNRMILGDSLVVMNSLLEYEGMAGQVQMIYMDPPYGADNFKVVICYRRLGMMVGEEMQSSAHYLLWYAKDRTRVKEKEKKVFEPRVQTNAGGRRTPKVSTGSLLWVD